VKRACPTIQELLAFDAVARHESLTRAASALCVSVSAVSKQLAGLEAFLGRPLLQKSGRGVELTPAGRDYFAKISPGLRMIETASFEVRAGGAGAGTIALASVPTFLTKWLIPRLADFRRAHPGVTFSFSQHLGPSEGLAGDLDAAIRYGEGAWPGMRSDYIAGKEFVCVFSPRLAAEVKLAAPKDLLGQTFLHHEQASHAWGRWALGNQVDEAMTLSGPRFAQYSAIIQAAVSGLGVALVPAVLVEDELRESTLVPCGAAVELGHGHYLCFDPARLERPIFAAFRSWVLAQGRQPLR
jgi:LysR family glycine cleavage system transcriptional activator